VHLEEHQQRPASERISGHRVVSAGCIIWRCIIRRCIYPRSCLEPREQCIECREPDSELKQ
jgi:hypothetical protein